MSRAVCSTSALTPSQVSRVLACGRPIQLVKATGVQQTAFLCGQRWCARCAEAKSRRAFALMLSRLEEHGHGGCYLVTLTQRSTKGLDSINLAWALQRSRQTWQTTGSLLRWDDRRLRRGEKSTLRPSRVHVPDAQAAAAGELADRWRCFDGLGGRWVGAAGRTTLLWTIELTPGAGGWHLHRHLITPDLVTAERVVAAYSSAIRNDRVQASSAPVCSIVQTESAAHTAAYVASYVAGGKKDGGWRSSIADLPEHAQAAWVSVMRGARRWDAWGDWRPLGISYREERPEEDRLLGIIDRGELLDPPSFYRSAGQRFRDEQLRKLAERDALDRCPRAPRSSQCATQHPPGGYSTSPQTALGGDVWACRAGRSPGIQQSVCGRGVKIRGAPPPSLIDALRGLRDIGSQFSLTVGDQLDRFLDTPSAGACVHPLAPRATEGAGS